MGKKSSLPPVPQPKAENITFSKGQHALSALGSNTAQTVNKFFSGNGLFQKLTDQDLIELSEAFKPKWTDEKSAELLVWIYEQQNIGKVIKITPLSRWILSHPNEVNSVKDCMSITPPKDFQITKVLSRAGSQKLVFLAQWTIAQKQVVLKALKEDSDQSDLIVERESQAHPINLTVH